MSDANPAETILMLSTAYWASRCLHVVAEAGVADALDDEPKTAAQLAGKTGVNAPALHRLLRALVSHGIFELEDGRFSHNAASRLLRTDAEGSMRSRAIMDGLPVHWNAYGALGHALKTGRPAVEAVIDGNFFAYLSAHPDEARIFAGAMVGKSYTQIGPVLEVYDFSSMKTIGDIGGGVGHLLSAVLKATPGAKGVLFDLPDVVDQARPVADPRINYLGGDFFKDPIPPCNAYMLMMVLHDWSDEESIAILKNIKATAPADAKYLIIEGVVVESMKGNFLTDVDVEMMALTTGRERTRAEWEAVVSGAGLKITRILPAGPWNAIIEATRA